MTARIYEIAGGQARPRGDASDITGASSTLPAGSYTTLRTYGGRSLVRLDQHLSRLEESLGARPVPLQRDRVRAGLGAAIRAAGYQESRMRLTFAPPLLFASIEPFVGPPEHLYREGAWCVSLFLSRDNPHAKDTRFLATADDARRRLPDGAHEGLLIAEDGTILEGLSSNVFAIRGGRLHTEEARALRGITRALVLDAATAVLARGEGPPRLAELDLVQECFLTSVSRGILPVARIDDHAIAAAPGPLTRALQSRFAELIAVEAEPLG